MSGTNTKCVENICVYMVHTWHIEGDRLNLCSSYFSVRLRCCTRFTRIYFGLIIIQYIIIQKQT